MKQVEKRVVARGYFFLPPPPPQPIQKAFEKKCKDDIFTILLSFSFMPPKKKANVIDVKHTVRIGCYLTGYNIKESGIY